MEAQKSGRGAKRKKREVASHRQAQTQEAISPLRIPTPSPDSILKSPSNTPAEEVRPNEEAIANEGQKKIPPCGKAKLLVLSKRKNKDPIPLDFNARSQPIGANASLFASFIGVTARELIPCTCDGWNDLSDTFKNDLWKHIKGNFSFDDMYKKNVIQRMMKLWQDNRAALMREVENQAKVVGLQRAAALLKPSNIESNEKWAAFVKHRTSEQFKEKCQKFQKMRKEITLRHRTSRKSFARVEEELMQIAENSEEVPPGKQGSDGAAAQQPEAVVRVKELLEKEGPSEKPLLKDDAVYKVLGPDPRGRVRGLGFGALPSKADHQAAVGSKVMHLEKTMFTQSKEIAELKEMVQLMLSRAERNGSNSVGVSAGKSVNSSLHEVAQSNKTFVTGEKCATNQKQTPSPVASKTGDRVELLSWFNPEEEVVASGKIESKVPSIMVHHVPLGPDCWKVWVVDVYEDVALYRPTSEFSTLNAAQRSTIAWPIKYIKPL